jgi:hypothetical protein
MTPHRQDVQCKGCSARLELVAVKDGAAKARTIFNVQCPVCGTGFAAEAPCGIDVPSVQIVGYESKTGSAGKPGAVPNRD